MFLKIESGKNLPAAPLSSTQGFVPHSQPAIRSFRSVFDRFLFERQDYIDLRSSPLFLPLPELQPVVAASHCRYGCIPSAAPGEEGEEEEGMGGGGGVRHTLTHREQTSKQDDRGVEGKAKRLKWQSKVSSVCSVPGKQPKDGKKPEPCKPILKVEYKTTRSG